MDYLATCQVGRFVAANSSGDEHSPMTPEIWLLHVGGHRRLHRIKFERSLHFNGTFSLFVTFRWFSFWKLVSCCKK
jgi:hypothetical protein